MAPLQINTIQPNFGKSGRKLLPVVLQNVVSGEVLFVAFTNRQAFNLSLERGEVYLWSRSKRKLWHKGATSGDFLKLIEARINCNQDSLLYLVKPLGKGVCHNQDENGNNYSTCYYRKIAYRYLPMIKGEQTMEKRRRIALPNGSLQEKAFALLGKCGIVPVINGRNGEIKLAGNQFFDSALLLRPHDIPDAVAKGIVDAGIPGLDMVYEREPERLDRPATDFALKIVTTLPYGRGGNQPVKVVLFGPPDAKPPERQAAVKIRSEYPNLAHYSYPAAEIIGSPGTSEIMVKMASDELGMCVVDSGETIKDNGLVILKTILVSPVVLIAREITPRLQALGEMLKGALLAQEMQLLKMNADNTLIPAILNVLPSLHSPTINPLADGWSAIEAVVPKDGLVDLYLELRSIGATGIIWHDLNVVVP